MRKLLFIFTMLTLLCMPAAMRAQSQTVEVGTQSGSTTNNQFLPGYNYFKYSYTQQIYTADEIDAAGTIYSISFKNTGAEKTRTYKIYMAHTDKMTFASKTDWVPMSENDLVYEGTITFAVDEWTTINLDVPFAYDGTSNLILSVADNTGSYSNSPHMACLVYSATGQAIRAYRDASAYDISAPGVNGTILNVKNQIILEINSNGQFCSKPTHVTVDYISGTTATVSWTSDASSINIDVNGTVTEGIASPYTLSCELGSTYNIALQANCGNGLVSNWTNPVSFHTDCCMPEDKCELTFELTDDYGDGWNGNAIRVTDVQTGFVLGELTNENLNGTQGYGEDELNTLTLAVCPGRAIEFSWVSGSYTEETSYIVYDRNGDEIFSGSGAMTTPYLYVVDCTVSNCKKPRNLGLTSDPAARTAEIQWTEIGTATEWVVAYKANGATDFSEVNVTSNPYLLENLSPETEYTVKVRSACEGGMVKWSHEFSFTTVADCRTPILSTEGISDITAYTANVAWTGFQENESYVVSHRVKPYYDGYNDDFTAFTSWGDEWNRYSGLLSDVMNGGALTSYNGGWAIAVGSNGVFDRHVRLYITSTNRKYWLVSPRVTVGNANVLNFDLALTASSSTLTPPQTTGYDDKFVVLISTDSMATWTILRQWDNDGSEYVYNNITCSETGENVTIDLSSYSGQNVNIAFYGESTVSNANNYVHIDNVAVGVYVIPDDWHTSTATDTSTTLTNLSPETKYEVKVKGLCANNGESTESDIVTFTTDVSCPEPAFTSYTISNNSVSLSWIENGTATAWQICLNDDENNLINVTENPYTIGNLNYETYYSVKVRANCGEGDVSHWSIPVSFTTPIACPAPTALSIYNITNSGAYLVWYENGSANAWQICVNGDEDHLIDVTDYYYDLGNLSPETNYAVKVRANCGGEYGVSAWSSEVIFTTEPSCRAPGIMDWYVWNIMGHTATVAWDGYEEHESFIVKYRTKQHTDGTVEAFSTTAVPDGWGRYSGLLDNVMNGGTLTSSSGSTAWAFGAKNGVFDNHAYFNIYNNNRNGWLVTPEITVGSNYALTFDLALTAYTGTLQAPQTTGTDDKFVVLISTDNMATWTILRQWDNAGSEYVYNNITCSAAGENVNIDLSNYSGQNVNIAFYGESTVSNADNDLHIDNMVVGEFTAAGEWQTITTTEPYTELSGLEAETMYELNVTGICANDGESYPSNTITFTTTAPCIAPYAPYTWNITSTTLELFWDYYVYSDAWQICINGDESNLIDVSYPPYTLENLTPGTEYYVKVRANCGGEDGVSAWSDETVLTTGCAPKDLPFVFGFEEDEENYCWSKQYCDNAYETTEEHHTGSSSFKFDYSYSYQYLISPELNASNNVKLSFLHKGGSDQQAMTFYVGYTTSIPNDLGYFYFNEFTVSDPNTWQEFSIEFHNSDSIKQIAIVKYPDGYNLFIDDIEVRDITYGDTFAEACETFDWYEHTGITASCEDLTHIFATATGDSIVTLHLTINQPSSGIDDQIVCDSLRWINGILYTESIDGPEVTLINAAGCDSVVTLHLTVNHSSTGTDEWTICDSELPYEWNGVTFTEAGSQTITLTSANASGCDSVVTMTLTVNHSSTGIDEVAICDSELPYDWNGVTFTEAGSQTVTLTGANASGCDSVVTMTLTVNVPTHGDIYDSVCAGLQYNWNNGFVVNTTAEQAGQHMTYESTDSQYFTAGALTNANGCDSTVTLHLYIKDCGDQSCGNTVYDQQLNAYGTMEIVNPANNHHLCWMTSNLRATHYADGEEIPFAIAYSRQGEPVNENDLVTYGRLYNHSSATRDSVNKPVQGVCPNGWHLPSAAEFDALINQYTVYELRSTSNWLTNSFSAQGTNASGFNMEPAGIYNAAKARCESICEACYYYTSEIIGGTAYINLYSYCGCDQFSFEFSPDPENGYSVRCVKDLGVQ